MLTRDRLLSWTLVLGTAILLALSIAIALPLLPALTWATVLAILARPIHKRVASRIPNQSIAAFTSVVIVAVVIIGPVVWISFEVTQEVSDGIKQIQTGISSGAWEAAAKRHPSLMHAYEWLNQRVDLTSAATDMVKSLQGLVTHALGKTIKTVVECFISLFALFFFFRDHREIRQAIRIRLPLSDSEIQLLTSRTAAMVRATIFGRILTSLIQGTLGGLMFWILGIKAALVWAVIMAVFSMIPAVGSVFIWGPAAAWLALSGDWTKAIILTAWGTAVIGTIDNFLYPLFVGRDVKIHTLLLFVALLGGVVVFGTTGLVLGPVILQTALSLIEILRKRTSAGSNDPAPATPGTSSNPAVSR